ncbi:MAG: hypothetical protein ACRCUS_07350, partial [Anaerovoracaceae bacterium]
FDDEKDYNKISLGDELLLENAQLQRQHNREHNNVANNSNVVLKNLTKGETYKLIDNLAEIEKDLILAGGKINYLKNGNE